MMSIFKTIFDLLVPPRQTERIVSTLTLNDLYNLQTTEGLPYHSREAAALVWELKYYANPRAAKLAGALLADELVMLAAEEVGTPLLIPVPMHKTRRRERGHNQTEVLCEATLEALVKKNGSNVFDYVPNVLVRTVATQQQQGLPKHKRLNNVHGSMAVVDKTKVKDRACIVVDDVSTTGATLAEAKRALMRAGARSVHSVALAHS